MFREFGVLEPYEMSSILDFERVLHRGIAVPEPYEMSSILDE